MKKNTLQTARRGPMRDGEVMARVAQGELAALGELYDAYAGSLLRFAQRVAPNGEAEDVVQATFLRVVRIAGSFDRNTASARPGLFAIATRVMQERRRSLRRFSTALLGFARLPREPVKHAEGTGSDLELGLCKLSDAKRMVLLLSEVEGFTCEEIAVMLEVPVGTVWTRLHHARRELRGFFAEE